LSEAGDYSETVRELFAAAPRSGALPPGPGRRIQGEVRALDRGAWVLFELRLQDGIIADARFRAWGCPHLIAACALVTGRLVSRRAQEACRFDPLELSRELRVPAEKLGRLLVLEDALAQLAAGMAEAQ
jgi:NifU-like protein involved in Fe-S cluster formation